MVWKIENNSKVHNRKVVSPAHIMIKLHIFRESLVQVEKFIEAVIFFNLLLELENLRKIPLAEIVTAGYFL